MRKNYEPLSEEDRRFLLAEATKDEPGKITEVWLLLLWVATGTAVFSILALLGLGILARIAGFQVSGGAWRENPVTYFGAIATVALVFAYVVFSSLRWLIKSRRGDAEQRRAALADLEKGEVKVERLGVLGVKLLQEPEHYTFIFLLNLSIGKTLVLYDYDSFDDENDAPKEAKPALQVRDHITLRTFPVSKRKRWEFEGAEMALPEPIELALDPEKWPDDEGWCRVKWENIERHYGPKADR